MHFLWVLYLSTLCLLKNKLSKALSEGSVSNPVSSDSLLKMPRTCSGTLAFMPCLHKCTTWGWAGQDGKEQRSLDNSTFSPKLEPGIVAFTAQSPSPHPTLIPGQWKYLLSHGAEVCHVWQTVACRSLVLTDVLRQSQNCILNVQRKLEWAHLR